MKPTLLLCAAVLTLGTSAAPERYGFVAMLGNDTISVERVTRTPTSLITDGVDRFPLVKLRHTEFTIAPDGRISHMVMDVRTPNAKTPAARARRVTAEFTNSSVLVTVTDSSGSKSRSFDTQGLITVPHVSMMYSVIELEVASALQHAKAIGMHAGDSVRFHQFYPDRNVGGSFVLHEGFVHPLGGNKIELWHDWLAGYGDITVDNDGRMLTYSGMRSTYKVAVRRIKELPNVDAIGASFAAAEQKSGASELSVRDTARADIGPAKISVDYGRPLARGRVLLGNVIDYDRVWRTGANAATQFATTAPITLDGLDLPVGVYTLWTDPHSNGVSLIVNKESGQWGTEYDHTRDLGNAPLHVETNTTPVEKMTISIVPVDATHGTLVIAWGTFRWTAPIVVKR